MAFNPFTALTLLDDVTSMVKYAITDQEKEGREAGIKTAANIYAPILREMEKQHSQIVADIDKEIESFEEKVNNIRERCSTFEEKISDATMTIQSMRGQSESMDNLIENMAINGIPCTLSSPTILSIIFSNYGLGNYLEEKMNKKRQEYFQIEFEKKSREWQERIKERRTNIESLIKNLSNLQESNQEQLQRISRILDERISKYCEKAAQLNLLQLVRS